MIDLTRLNDIQCRALELVAQGMSASKDISRALDRSPGTIDNYLSQAAAVLGVSTRETGWPKRLYVRTGSPLFLKRFLLALFRSRF